MIRFQAEKFLEIIQEHTQAEHLLKELFGKPEDVNQPISESNRKFFVDILGQVQKLADSISLNTLSEYINIAKQQIGWSTSTAQQVMYFNRGICDVLMAEVKAHIFLQVDPGKRDLYIAAITDTLQLASAYPKVKLELLEAHLCFAFERYTACVHHLMIAVEVAMRKWAAKYKLKPRRPVTVEDWEEILKAADRRLAELVNKPRTTRNFKRQEHLAQTAMHFRFIKEGYRKHSAHGRTHFDESSAKVVMTHVNEFMRLLAPMARKTVPALGQSMTAGQGLFGLGLGLGVFNTPLPSEQPENPGGN